MNERPHGFLPLMELLPTLEKLASLTRLADASELVAQFHSRLIEEMNRAFQLETALPIPRIENDYPQLAGDLASRDTLRAIHFTLTDCRAWVNAHPFQLGRQSQQACIDSLRGLSAYAVSGARWSYGVAYMMAAKALGSFVRYDPVDVANEVVMDLVRRIRNGTSWYDPVCERQPGGWFTTFYYRLARRFRHPPGTHSFDQLEATSKILATGPKFSTPSVDEELIANNDMRRIASIEGLLAQLPEMERQVIRDLYWNDKLQSEIGANFEIGKPAVRKLRDAALVRLAMLLRSLDQW